MALEGHSITNLDGFEHGSLGMVKGVTLASAGAVTIPTDRPRTGLRSLKVVTGGGVAAYCEMPIRYSTSGRFNTTDVPYCFFSGYLNIDATGAPKTRIMSFYDGQPGAPTERARVSLYGTDLTPAERTMEIAALGFGTSTIILAEDIWYLIELKFFSAAGVEELTLWVNGVQEASVTGINGPNNDIDSIVLGTRAAEAGTGFTYYWDDVIVEGATVSTDVTRPGPHRIGRLDIEGDGAHTAWTAVGAASDFQCVDEIPPNDNTDYVESDANAVNAATFALESADSARIAGRIEAVKTTIDCEEPEASGSAGSAIRRRRSATDYDTATGVCQGTYFGRSKIDEIDPSTGARWTRAGLDDLEAGAVTINDADPTIHTRITAVSVEAAYRPGMAKINPRDLGPMGASRFGRAGVLIG